jgi:hypothetical protein
VRLDQVDRLRLNYSEVLTETKSSHVTNQPNQGNIIKFHRLQFESRYEICMLYCINISFFTLMQLGMPCNVESGWYHHLIEWAEWWRELPTRGTSYLHVVIQNSILFRTRFFDDFRRIFNPSLFTLVNCLQN